MKINVPEKYADLYLKALSEKKRALEERIEEFRREIEEIDTHISNLTSLPIFQEPQFQTVVKWDTATYRTQWSWTRKISFFQDTHRFLSTSGDVVDFILEKEPEQDKSKVRSSVSAALSNGIRSGQYKKFTDPVTNTAYYGPADWFDSNDQPDVSFLPESLRQRLTG
ncbi:hypothetical protein [Fulvivirga sedimenti]|uniref:Uncharacterized protein n=1 Tax=Fulvivirga sedimenti TaxID=2879465 RepID=A0A9X1HTW7_9BACT|nr:hypothetical protein [Fulvivirga sedimenti]MCA6078219.1 hypothetical protein [Fulvivirga sedimenti]